jgi:hypothetical protein
LELKVGERDGLWHAHLHCLVNGSFIDQRTLSTEWHSVTGDSSIVDVRAVPDAGHAARYVAKYATKPADASVYKSQDHLDEMICSLSKRRLCLTWGTWRGVDLDAPIEDNHEWSKRQPIAMLVANAKLGDLAAAAICKQIAAKHALFAKLFTWTPDPVDPP